MSNLDQARRDVRAVATKMLGVVNDPKLDPARKRAAALKLEAEMASAQAALTDAEYVVKSASWAAGGGDALAPGAAGAVPSDYAQKNSRLGGGEYRIGAVPSLWLPEEELEQMHAAAVRGKGFRVPELGLKTPVMGADMPQSTFPQRIDPAFISRREPNRIANLIPSMATTSPVVEYFVQSARVTAGVVAEGGAKPGSVVSAPAKTATVAKIAAWIDATLETLNDFPDFRSFCENDLAAAVIDAENAELLSGSGTSPHNITGLLNTTGILTRAYPASPATGYTALDTFDQATNDLRIGASYAEPDNWIMSPTTYSSIRRAKDGYGRFLLDADPSTEQRQQLWGVPVTLTTQMPDGTALGGSFADAARVFVRQTLGIVIDPYTQLKANITTIVAEERLGMFVQRPASLVKITGLPTA